jgi:hypothetical protein
MKKHKKVLLAVILAAAIIAGSIGGVILASDEGDEDSATPGFGSFIDRVLELYQEKTNTVIDKEALQEAFKEAREEMREEQPRFRLHDRILDDDELTQEQREEIEAWLEARPEFPTDEFKEWMESRPGIVSEEFKEWLESRPDIDSEEFEEWLESMPEDIPFNFGFHSKLGPRIFGHIGKSAGGFTFGCLDSENDA